MQMMMSCSLAAAQNVHSSVCNFLEWDFDGRFFQIVCVLSLRGHVLEWDVDNRISVFIRKRKRTTVNNRQKHAWLLHAPPKSRMYQNCPDFWCAIITVFGSHNNQQFDRCQIVGGGVVACRHFPNTTKPSSMAAVQASIAVPIQLVGRVLRCRLEPSGRCRRFSDEKRD